LVTLHALCIVLGVLGILYVSAHSQK